MQQFLRAATEDKLLLQALLHQPTEPSEQIVIHIHGMTGNFYDNRFLDAMSDTFTTGGWAFLCPNTRGHDVIADIPVAGDEENYERIGNANEIFEDCVKDIKCWVDVAESKGYKDIVLAGHSLGAVKAAYYVAQTNDKRVNRLVLASPPDMIGLAEQEKDHQERVKLAKQMINEGKEKELMPGLLWDWYYLTPKTFLNLGMRDGEVDVFNTYDSQKESKTLSTITIPTLAFCGGKDDANIMPAEEAMGLIKQKSPNVSDFSTGVIPDANHVYFGHESEVANLIYNWL